jgi:hypothetical protein
MEVVKIEGKRAIQISRQQQIAAGMETHRKSGNYYYILNRETFKEDRIML